MRRLGVLIKYLFWLGVIGLFALAIYALLSELPAPEREIAEPLPLPSGDR